MKPIEDRTWTTDFEQVYAVSKAYVGLFNKLSELASPLVSIQNVEEKWHYENESINIEICYTSNGHSHKLWTPRSNDYFETNLLFLLNRQLGLTDYKFEVGDREELFFFINADEKDSLQGSDEQVAHLNPLMCMDLIIHNLLMGCQNGHSDFTYGLITLLNDHLLTFEEVIVEQQARIKQIQNRLFHEVLPSLDWQKIADRKIQMENIYTFIDMKPVN